jgi:Uma2 family endonuclease
LSVLTPSLPRLPKKAAVPTDYIWPLTVEQYHEMIRAGILTEDDPVELLEGFLVVKMSKNPAHCLATDETRSALERLLPAGWFTKGQDPITTEISEPEPDITVVRGTRRQYADHHPGPQDLALVVEVAEATLARDRGVKKRDYARNSISIYWIVNLVDGQIEVYSDPAGPTEQPDYRQHKDYRPDDQLPVVIEGKEIGRIGVRDLLP